MHVQIHGHGWMDERRAHTWMRATHGCVHLHAFKSCIHMNMRIMYAYLYASYMRNMRIRTCADLLHLVVNEPTGVCMCVRMCIRHIRVHACALINEQERVVEKFVPVEVTVPGPPQIETKIVVREVEVPVEIKVQTLQFTCKQAACTRAHAQEADVHAHADKHARSHTHTYACATHTQTLGEEKRF